MFVRPLFCFFGCLLWVGFVGAADFTGITVKLEPKILKEELSDTVKIPIDTIRPFLKTSLILNGKDQFLKAPYVVAAENEQLESGARTLIYVRGLGEIEEFTHQIYREGQTYIHPTTKENLGFEALTIGTAELKENGDPAQFILITADEPVEIGARVFPSYASVLPHSLKLRPANPLKSDGYILSARDATGEIGINQIVVISLGQREGIEEGNYLDVYQTGRTVVDPNAKSWLKHKIQLPDRQVGRVIVFQTYEKVSLGLVLEAKEIIHLLDKVKSP